MHDDKHYGYAEKIRRRECYVSLSTIITLIKRDYCNTVSNVQALLTPFFLCENASKNVVLAIVRSRHATDLVYKMKDTRPGTDNWFFEPQFLGRVLKVWITENMYPYPYDDDKNGTVGLPRWPL